MVSQSAKLIQCARHDLAVRGFNVQILCCDIQQLFAAVVSEHANQRVVDFEQPAIWSRKIGSFLNVVEELPVKPFGTPACGDVFENVHNLL